jgi:hypothetical protein
MAQDMKNSQPVRLPNPSAQPFVAALKTARLFAVVFFWITMISVLAYVVGFVLAEWVGLYDDPAVASVPAETGKTPAAKPGAEPAPTATPGGVSWSGLFENSAQAASKTGSTSFFGVEAGPPGSKDKDKEEPEAVEPPAPVVAPKTDPVPVKAAPKAAPVKGDETQGKIVGKTEAPPPVAKPTLSLEEQQRQRAKDARDVTINILKPLRVVGVMSGFLLGMTIFLYLQIALLGRLGGIKQLTSSLFMCMLFLASVLPWDTIFAGFHVNAFYDFDLMWKTHLTMLHDADVEAWKVALYYCRFFGLPVVSALLLAWSGIQFASGYSDSVTANE